MNNIVRTWRKWKHGRKFARIGKGCQFPGRFLEVTGHVELGDYCRIRDYVVLRASGEGKILFGDRAGASYHVIIEATQRVEIGPRTGIAEFTVLRDSNHMVLGTDLHWRTTPLVARPILIGADCLIGSGCYIMPGVTIGDGAVIQAGSLVDKDVGAYEIWAGNPARRVCHRTQNLPERFRREAEERLAIYGVKDDRYMEDPRRAAREEDGEF